MFLWYWICIASPSTKMAEVESQRQYWISPRRLQPARFSSVSPVISAKMSTNYPDLKPSNKFCNQVQVPTSWYKSLSLSQFTDTAQPTAGATDRTASTTAQTILHSQWCSGKFLFGGMLSPFPPFPLKVGPFYPPKGSEEHHHLRCRIGGKAMAGSHKCISEHFCIPETASTNTKFCIISPPENDRT